MSIFYERARFTQKVKILDPDYVIKGSYEYQVCTDATGKCIPGDGEFEFRGRKAGTAGAKESTGLLQKRDSTDPYSLLSFMLVAFLAGLAALLTPCVFPMIPMTVTYFTGKDNHKRGV